MGRSLQGRYVCQLLEVAESMGIGCTNLIPRSTHKAGGGLQSSPIALGALLRNIIACTELDIGFLEVVFHPTYGISSSE